MSECNICFNKIEPNIQYAKIDNPDEVGSYHVNCLTNWLRTSGNHGIMTQTKVTGYYICINGEKIIKINVNIVPSAPPTDTFTPIIYPPQSYDPTPIVYQSQNPPMIYNQQENYSNLRVYPESSHCPETSHCPEDHRVIFPQGEEYIDNNRYYHDDRCQNRSKNIVCGIVSIVFIVMAVLTFIYVTRS